MAKKKPKVIEEAEFKLEVLGRNQPILIENRLTDKQKFSAQIASSHGGYGFKTGRTKITINIEDKVGFFIDRESGKGMMYRLLNPIRPGQSIVFNSKYHRLYAGYDEVQSAIESMPRTISSYLQEYLEENFKRK